MPTLPANPHPLVRETQKRSSFGSLDARLRFSEHGLIGDLPAILPREPPQPIFRVRRELVAWAL
jgi:hypothetical protein